MAARVNNCCLCIPLRAGAFIVAAWMLILNLYAGISLLINETYYTSSSYKVIGVIYLLVALIAFYGIHGIYNEIPSSVKWFTRFFLASLIVYIVVGVVVVILSSIAGANFKKACEEQYPDQAEFCKSNFSFTSWIIGFAIGIIFDIYLYIVLRSYSKELEERSTSAPSRNA